MTLRSLLFLLLLAATSAHAQITEILNAPLVFEIQDDYPLLDNEPEGYEGWYFDNCYQQKGVPELQIGSKTAPGSVTTPPLSGLKGNARIVFEASEFEPFTIKLKAEGNGLLATSGVKPSTTEKWERMPCVLMRSASADTRLSIRSEAAANTFQIRNLLVSDIGNYIYYETFDRSSGNWGNGVELSVDNTNEVMKAATFDYYGSTFYELKKAPGCTFFNGNADKPTTYTTASIPVTNASSGKFLVAFRVAGATDFINHQLQVLNGKKVVGSAEVEQGRWKDVEIEVDGPLTDNKLTFSGYNCFLDDVRVSEIATSQITVSEDEDNASRLTGKKGTLADVTLKRTLGSGYWNTLCLPFDFRADMLGVDAELLQLADVVDGVFDFQPVSVVLSGHPFLIRVAETVVNPEFHDVIVRHSAPLTDTFGSYSFIGTFGPTELQTNGAQMFLGTDGQLYLPEADDHTIGGLRAYFQVPQNQPARLRLSGDEATAVAPLPAAATDHRLYNLWGQRLSAGQAVRGVYINNGKKIIK